jgi:hypothetical protein
MTSVLPHACRPERQPARPLAASSPADSVSPSLWAWFSVPSIA